MEDMLSGLFFGFCLLFVLLIVAVVGLYYFVFPYYLAKNLPITKNFFADCAISYILCFAFAIVGNAVYMLLNFIVNQNSKTTTV